MGIANIINTSTSSGGGGGEIIRELVNSSDGQGLHLESGGNIELVNSAGAEFGTSDFSIELILNQEKENTSESYIYVTHVSGNNRLLIFHDVSDDNLVLDFRNNSGTSTKKDLAYDMNSDFGEPTHYVISADRSGNAVLYRNGTEVASVDISSLSTINIGDGNTTSGRIGTALTDGLIGSLYRFRTWNKALTHDEVDTCFQRADVDFADQYGSQATINSGTTTTGINYRITARNGVDFTTVGAANNNVGTEFKATGSVTLDANDTVVQIGAVTDYDLAFANPTQSLIVQDRAGVADGTASATGVSQTQKIVQLNAVAARIGTTAATPGDGELFVGGQVKIEKDGLALKIDGTANTAKGILLRNTGNQHGYLHTDGSLKLIAEDAGKTMSFYTANDGTGTARMVIDAAGIVTINNDLVINDATGLASIKLQGGAAGADNFQIMQGVTGVSNAGLSIYDVDATATRLSISSTGAVTIGAFTLPTADGTNGQVLQTNGSGTVTWEDSGGGGGSGVTGSGTDTYVPRWNGTSALEDSVIVAADNGSVGFGIASPSYRIHSTSVVCCEDGAPAFRLSGTAISAKLIDLKCDIGVFKLRDVNGGAEFYNVTNTYHKWYINSNEVMQMNSSGNLLVGCTSVPDASNAGITLNGLTGGNRSSSGAPTTAYNHWTFYNGNGIVGTISTSGSATAYNTSSDYRLKENVVPLTDALDRIDEIPVYRFNFKSEPDITVDGFLADEVAPHVPESVTGTRDGMKTVVIQEGKEQRDYVAPEFWGEDDELPEDVKVGDLKIAEVQAQEYQEEITEEQPDYQQIDQSKLVPLLIAAVKELKAKVEALENA